MHLAQGVQALQDSNAGVTQGHNTPPRILAMLHLEVVEKERQSLNFDREISGQGISKPLPSIVVLRPCRMRVMQDKSSLCLYTSRFRVNDIKNWSRYCTELM